MIGHPSQCEFEVMVHEKMIQNYPVKPHDVTNAYKIFGPYHEEINGEDSLEETSECSTGVCEGINIDN